MARTSESTLIESAAAFAILSIVLMFPGRLFGEPPDADPPTFIGIYEGRSVAAWTDDLLNRYDDARRSKIALSLMGEEAAEALPALLTRWYYETSPRDRERTASAAGATAHRHEHLIAFAKRLRLERDEYVRLGAVQALGPRGEAERERWELLLSIATSDSGAPQVSAIESLAELPPRSEMEIMAVRRLLGAKEPEVGPAAARTLARWGVIDDESASQIRVLLDASSELVERITLSAALVSSTAGHDHGVKVLTDVLSRTSDAEMLLKGLAGVERTGRRGAAMRPAVTSLLVSKEPRIVEAALDALRSIGCDSSAEDGIASAAHSVDIRVRLAATGAAASLIPKESEKVAAEIRKLRLDTEPQIRLAASLTIWLRSGKEPDDSRLEDEWSKARYAQRNFILWHLRDAPVLPHGWRKVLEDRVSREPEASLRSAMRGVLLSGRFSEKGK